MTEQKQTIGIKELAEKAKIKPTILRRVLRVKFPRANKGKAYEWQQGDPQIEQILKAVKDNHKPENPQPKAKNTAVKKATKPVKPNGNKVKKELATVGAES